MSTRELAGEPQERAGAAAPPGRSTLWEEILVVLALSLLESAVFGLISLLSAPVSGVAVVLFPRVSLVRQLASLAFALAPVWLVLHLVRRSGEGPGSIGLAAGRAGSVVGQGAALAAVVGAAGIGVYLAAVELGVNRFVVPVPPTGYWWTVPVLVLGAAKAAMLEEVIGVGYLMTRLRQLAWRPEAILAATALLRGSYHLFQGWGGFAGNVAMGLLFGWIFLRTGRLWPLIVAHFLLDVGAGVGYLLFRDVLPGL